MLKKRKARQSENSDTSFEEAGISHPQRKDHNTTVKKKLPKKRKVVISFSSDSFEEDVKDSILIPSKSESDLQNSIDKSNRAKTSIEESNESERSVSPFNLDEFFNAYEPNLDESVTMAHSGIDNEFETEYIGTVNIVTGGQSKESSDEEATNNAAQTTENIIISDSSDTYPVTDTCVQNILEVASKIEETVVLDDNVEDQDSPEMVSESPQHEEPLEEHAPPDYYDLEDHKLLVLKENQSIAVHGLLTLKVLYGKVEVSGSVLDKESKEVSLYSPRGSALLKITNLSTDEDALGGDINDILTTFGSNAMPKTYALLKCTQLNDVRMPFVEKYISQQIFPRGNNSTLPKAVFEPVGNWNVIRENSKWTDILLDVKPSTRLLLAGGKGVGKSTFLRFAINRLLNVFEKIRVIDLDPGQSEFSVPGCISVVSVTEPVFGPNYTHLRTTDRSLLSNINVGHDPRSYIKSVQALMMYYETLPECPTLINTMGFVQGIGLNIISSAIIFIQPTEVIQIESRKSSKNFRTNLSIEVVHQNCDLFESNRVTLNYNLRKIEAMSDNRDGWSLQPRESREMCVLSYFGQMMPPGTNSILSHKLPMYEVKLSSAKITSLEGEEIPPAAINANLVALCSLEDESDIAICLGYAIVRGIDLESETLVLLTPANPSILDKVDRLVLGSVALPPSMYMTADDVTGSIPYVMQGDLVSLGQITKRTYLPVNKK
ncbi:hypothetical protein NQ318_013703 [Aromia moschata]|uniref:Polynucleotide 5'-hydroxyl-kinase NOL9 n=1 Tax=Aromia moschata TaxID=1265417 RepID=A0AAV8Z8B6_9CUCU|nr:hypothetical protein NQ318_013703 [Aromia moschata]